MTTPRSFERINHLLQFVSNIKRALQQISEPQHLLILSLLVVPHHCHPHVLLSNHGLDRLRYGNFMIEYDQLLIIWEQVTYGILLEELADVALDLLNGLSLFVNGLLLLVFVDSLDAVAQSINRIFVTAIPGVVATLRGVLHRVVLEGAGAKADAISRAFVSVCDYVHCRLFSFDLIYFCLKFHD